MIFKTLQRTEIVGKMTDIKSMILFRESAFKLEKPPPPLIAKAPTPGFQLHPGLCVHSFLSSLSSPAPSFSPRTVPRLSGHRLTPSGHAAFICTRQAAFTCWLVKIRICWQVKRPFFWKTNVCKLAQWWISTFKRVFRTSKLQKSYQRGLNIKEHKQSFVVQQCYLAFLWNRFSPCL